MGGVRGDALQKATKQYVVAEVSTPPTFLLRLVSTFKIPASKFPRRHPVPLGSDLHDGDSGECVSVKHRVDDRGWPPPPRQAAGVHVQHAAEGGNAEVSQPAAFPVESPPPQLTSCFAALDFSPTWPKD